LPAYDKSNPNIVKRKLSLAELGRMSTEEHKKSQKLPVIIILDNLRSQHNIGSIFRTADAFRLEAIYLCGISATPPNREIHKTALGATESVSWKYFETTMQAVETLKNSGYRLCTVEQTEGSISLNDFMIPESSGLAVVFGNEVGGVEQAVVDASDYCVEIPQFGTKHSLNVAVTAGIMIWDVFNKFLARKPGFFN
jgi:tRNA G18 (ribose-2'-O)-methylase SpoU